ncbi:hypothetical protein D3C75_1182530 [compost metagenome]
MRLKLRSLSITAACALSRLAWAAAMSSGRSPLVMRASAAVALASSALARASTACWRLSSSRTSNVPSATWLPSATGTARTISLAVAVSSTRSRSRVPRAVPWVVGWQALSRPSRPSRVADSRQ